MLDANALAQLKQLKSDIKENKEIFAGKVKGSMSRFGFVIRDTDGKEFFLPPQQMERVFPGDQIEFEIFKDEKDKEYAEPSKLINSDFRFFAGKYHVKGKAHLVSPDVNQLNRMIFIPPIDRKKANNQDFVRCQLTRHPFQDGKAQAKITGIVGNKGTPFLEHGFTLAKFNLKDEFPLAASQQIDQLDDGLIEQAKDQRSDLTEVPFVTIDDEATKDMDDALFGEKTDQGWRIKIAIADPSPWFACQSPLDKEAQVRGTSVYFPGQVIPMLPARLSQNLCSLVAGFDRLALVMTVELDEQATPLDFNIEAAVIRSQGKLSYQQVNAFIDEQKSVDEKLDGSLAALSEATMALRQARLNNNLVMEDRLDYRYQLDENGKILSISGESRTPSRSLVEECMLLCNRLGAQWLHERNAGAFICQPGFREEKLEDVVSLLSQADTEWVESIKKELGDDLNNLNQLEPFVKLIRLANQQHPLLRKMLGKHFGRSELASTMTPHFAQGFTGYTTITSPIRKYLDLTNQRIIHQLLADEQPSLPLEDNWLSGLQDSQGAVRQSSNHVENWLKCQYIENFAGVTLEAEVSHINSIGFGVRIPENGVEGFVDLRQEKVKPEFNPLLMQFKFPASNEPALEARSLSLGDTVDIEFAEVNDDRKQILFKWVR